MTKRKKTTTELYNKEAEEFFGKVADQKARETKLVERMPKKISGSLFLQSLVWTVYQYGKITLPNLAGVARKLEPKCDASEQAFDLKFNAGGLLFLETMFAIALQQTVTDSSLVLPLVSVFSAVYILDSSTISLPQGLKDKFAGCGGAASSAGCKVFLLLDWLRGSYEAIRVREARKADQDMGKEFVEGKKRKALWMSDLGFWDLGFFSTINSLGSYFLTRLHAQVAVYAANRFGTIEKFDLDQFLQLAQRDRVFEFSVYVGAEYKLGARLLCAPVASQIAEYRRRRAKEDGRRRGRAPSQKALNRLDWSLFVTNAPATMLPTTSVPTIYRIRWQVELVFRLAKEDACLDETNSKRAERVLCEFYAKLIALINFNRLTRLLPANQDRSISYPKAWRRFKEEALDWGRKLRQKKGLSQLFRIIDYLQRRARVSKRIKQPSTVELIKLAADQALICLLVDPIGYLSSRAIGRPVKFSRFFVISKPQPLAA
jgi:hypothetical protein